MEGFIAALNFVMLALAFGVAWIAFAVGWGAYNALTGASIRIVWHKHTGGPAND